MKTIRQIIFSVLTVVIWTVCGAANGENLTVPSIIHDFSFSKNLPRELRWLPRSSRYACVRTDTATSVQSLIVTDAKSGLHHTLITSVQLPETSGIRLTSYHWLSDESGLVFEGKPDLWFYSVREKRFHQITNTDSSLSELQISPDNEWVSYVRNHNLFVHSIHSENEYQLTSDGDTDHLNGKLDWVYQEELVGRGIFQGYWWSPDSKHIAYLHFDETPVPKYPLVNWMPVHPKLSLESYPKAGDPNPVVKLGVVSIMDHPNTTWIDTGENTDIYLPRVYWFPHGKKLAFIRLDRLQQHLEFLAAEIMNGNSRVLLEEQDPYWINIEDQVKFLQQSSGFIWGSERNGFRHLYLYETDGTLINPVTSGEWVVEDLVGVNEDEGLIYFTATKKDVRERQLYQVKYDGSNLTQITRKTGTHQLKMSNDATYYIDEYSTILSPKHITLHDESGKLIRAIDTSAHLDTSKFNLHRPRFFAFSDDSGNVFYAKMLLPANFNPSKKYPVIVYVYGGPHAQEVTFNYGGRRALWNQMMAQKGYIIFSMDNRGSDNRGHQWEQVIYEQMGQTELADQLKGVAYLKSLSYVDSARIGIWGWSYGGYMTLYALTHTDAFSSGVSVAPVTDWRNYDTIYTERYMNLPVNNPNGYRTSAPVNVADSLHGDLLLMHGTYDDNVHFQNSVQMIESLIQSEKQFDLMVYPNKKHGISGDADQQFLYTKLTDYFDTHLSPQNSTAR